MEQLEKGQEWLEHSMKMLSMKPWSYVGFAVFPNIDNRKSLEETGLVKNEDKTKILTKNELDDPERKVLDKIFGKTNQLPADDTTYEKVLALFVGSYFVNTLDQVTPRVKDADFINTRDNLVKEHDLAKWRENEGELKEPEFVDLKDEPLGSVPSILFWNDQQRQIYTQVTSMEHTLLVGDYGTGKTLILEAAAKTLSERDDTEVVFICALDYNEDTKKSDDILDKMLREKYRGTRITFQSTADLRRDLQSHGTLSTLQLIKTYMENIKNSKKQVVIIDELSINNDDLKKMKAGETSELEETLAWLADNTAMTLAALSSTFLLDRITAGANDDDVSQTKLDEMIARTGFVESVQLEFIMRSSQNIAAATSPASFNQTQPGSVKIQETISRGSSSSTVPALALPGGSKTLSICAMMVSPSMPGTRGCVARVAAAVGDRCCGDW